MTIHATAVEPTDPTPGVLWLLLPSFGGDHQHQRVRAQGVVTRGRTFALLREGRPVAAAVAHVERDEFVLDAVGVDPCLRGQGLGRQLLTHVTGVCGAPHVIRLETDDTAVGFSRSLGFEVSPPPGRWPGTNRYACRRS